MVRKYHSVREHPHSTYGSVGGGGVGQISTKSYKGGGGVSQNSMYFLRDWSSIIGKSSFFSKKYQNSNNLGEEKGFVQLPCRGMQKFTKMLAIQGNQPSLCSPLDSFYGRLLTFALYAILLFRYRPRILSFLFFFLRGVTQNSMYVL